MREEKDVSMTARFWLEQGKGGAPFTEIQKTASRFILTLFTKLLMKKCILFFTAHDVNTPLAGICSRSHGRELGEAFLVKPPILLLEPSVSMLACSVITKSEWDINFSVLVMFVKGGRKESREVGREVGGKVSNHFIPSFKRPSGLFMVPLRQVKSFQWEN